MFDAHGAEAIFDRDATVRAYAALSSGATDTCPFLYCLNYRTARSREAYPQTLVAACDVIGIDILKEGETTPLESTGDGRYGYIGLFHFVGDVITEKCAPETEFINWGFTASLGPELEPFKGKRVGAISYSITLPWLLDEPCPERDQ
jgi:hypothetical protein